MSQSFLKSEVEYVIYADESAKDGEYYKNFYGGLLVPASQLNRINKLILDKKAELNIAAEMKWTKVTENYLNKYKELMNCFFDEVKQGSIKVRIMFIQKAYQSEKVYDEDSDIQYFKLYHTFLKNAFGIKFINSNCKIKFFLDKLPLDSKKKIKKFKNYISDIPQTLQNNHIKIHYEDITEIESSKHTLLQCIDIVLGAIQFRLNNKHKEKMGSKRGRKTVAKHELYKHIYKLIEGCTFTRFNIGTSTRWASSDSLWKDVYRHWNLKPDGSTMDLNLTKGAGKHKKRGPIDPT